MEVLATTINERIRSLKGKLHGAYFLSIKPSRDENFPIKIVKHNFGPCPAVHICLLISTYFARLEEKCVRRDQYESRFGLQSVSLCVD